MQLAQQPWHYDFLSGVRIASVPRSEPAAPANEVAALAPSSSATRDECVGVASRIGGELLGASVALDRLRDAAIARIATDADELEPRARSELVCRALNLALAALCLALFLPVLLLLAVGVKLSSRGPVLYTQTRVGIDRRWRRTLRLRDQRRVDLGGKTFTIYKFRSMRSDAERSTGAVWARAQDPRVTAFGRFLRKYHLDELPQLLNVVRGDMNFVGPRPERPSIAARLRQDIQGYALRHRVKPGITGLAQIHLRYDSSVEDVRRKVRYDVVYLRRQSVWLDLWILLRTAPAVLSNARGW